LRTGKREDHAFDLSPPAKTSDVPTVATGVRPRCGFKSGIQSEPIHQCLRICHYPPVSNKWKMIQRQRSRALDLRFKSRASFSVWPQARIAMIKPRFTKCQVGTMVPARDRVALHFGTWQRSPMKNDRKNPTGGGIFIALGAAAGVIIGRRYGQTSIGLVAGVAAGIAIATLIWWRERSS
jgi:hypothetical protein